ncbi:MAG: Na+/H+ antiporter subunit E [Alcanivorax sp.]|nr:Na+/H+ antiporter subunit E [Alcanivorax sp.]
MAARSWLPHPNLTLFLFIVWVLLMNTLSVGVVLLGALLAWWLPSITRAFWPEVPHVNSGWKLFRFMLLVLGDIVHANMVAFRLILGPTRKLHPAWIEMPIDLDDPFAVTVLASTISLTPGTVTVEVGRGHHKLLIHALNAEDPDALVAHLKARYETRIKEIFE